MGHTGLTELPEDILLLIFPYLHYKDYLSLCLINKHFHNTYRDEYSYWRYHANHVLHLPSHYQTKFEASSWRQMCEIYYRRARLFMWGNTRRPIYNSDHEQDGHLDWPTEIRSYDGMRVGAIVDIQCAYGGTASFSSNLIC